MLVIVVSFGNRVKPIFTIVSFYTNYTCYGIFKSISTAYLNTNVTLYL